MIAEGGFVHVVFALIKRIAIIQLEDDLQQIETLRKIDIFDFDSIKNEYLLEDIKKYGKQIY